MKKDIEMPKGILERGKIRYHWKAKQFSSSSSLDRKGKGANGRCALIRSGEPGRHVCLLFGANQNTL
jgi:hypothetical protein